MIINLVGDMCLQGINLEKYSIDNAVREILINAEVNVANLEGPMTESRNRKLFQPVYLKSKPEKNIIIDLFHVFSLANNHMMDYGDEGLLDTIKFLNRNDKYYFGAGKNILESMIPVKLTVKDKKIAFLGYTHWDNAKKRKHGTTPFCRTFLNTVKSLRNEDYFIIVYPHWNYEYVDYPAPDNRKIGHKLINIGVDLVVGSHPHVIQGIEEYKNNPLCILNERVLNMV